MLGIIPFERRETTLNVKLISTSFMEGKLCSHGLEFESTPRSELPSPLMHGWEFEDDKNVPIKCLKSAAPEAMLDLVKCGCKRGM